MRVLVTGWVNFVHGETTTAVSGGAKVQRQAKLAGWPVVLTADELSKKNAP